MARRQSLIESILDFKTRLIKKILFWIMTDFTSFFLPPKKLNCSSLTERLPLNKDPSKIHCGLKVHKAWLNYLHKNAVLEYYEV